MKNSRFDGRVLPEVRNEGLGFLQGRVVGGVAHLDRVLEIRVDLARLVGHLQLRKKTSFMQL